MNEERIEEVSKKLNQLALSEQKEAVMLLLESPIKPLELLANMGFSMVNVNKMREAEIRLRTKRMEEGRPVTISNEDHQAVYDAMKEVEGKVEEAYQATLRACAMMYILDTECECETCSSRRVIAVLVSSLFN